MNDRSFSIGDYIYFIEDEYEYEAEVVGINADGVVTVEHADKDGKLHKRPFGGRYMDKLNITEIKKR